MVEGEHGASKLLNVEVAHCSTNPLILQGCPDIFMATEILQLSQLRLEAECFRDLEWNTTPDEVVTARMWPQWGWKEQTARETRDLG